MTWAIESTGIDSYANVSLDDASFPTKLVIDLQAEVPSGSYQIVVSATVGSVTETKSIEIISCNVDSIEVDNLNDHMEIPHEGNIEVYLRTD